MNLLDLYSGIGGFALGLESVGFKTVAFCEIESYPRMVLRRHWPHVPIYDDVRKLTREVLERDGIRKINIICGGFPCQDISLAGKGAGIEGERSGLWSEYARLIEEIQPAWAVIENVRALLSRGIDRVLRDLSRIGYACEWYVISASDIGAPHKRDRLWIVAYPDDLRGAQQEGRKQEELERIVHGSENPFLANAHESGLQGRERGSGIGLIQRSKEIPAVGNSYHPRLQGLWKSIQRARERSAWSDGVIVRGYDGKERLLKPGLSPLADGVPFRVERIRSTGNAIIPGIAQAIGEAIMEWEAKKRC